MKRARGHTLVELAVVLTLLALVALAAASGPPPVSRSARLDATTQEVAAAIRFARSEAMRTGSPHGAQVDVSAQRVRVYRLVAGTPVYDVRHPLDKNLYELRLGESPSVRAGWLSGSWIRYVGDFWPTSFLGFDPSGTPKRDASGIQKMLESGSVWVSLDGHTRKIVVEPMLGRVSVQ